MARCLLNLFQAEVSVDQAGKLLDRMIVLSRTTHGYLEETMLVEYLEPSELGLLHHASTANELTDFLEALYRPLAAHYPRSMVASCQFSSAFLAGTILRAQARRNDVGFEEETLARSLSQADLPRGFMGDFHHLQRFHSTLSAQKHAIGKVRGKLRDLLFR
jgi:hypothetical protein